MTDSEQDNLFWLAPDRPDTYDIEETSSSPYGSYRNMVKQETQPFFHGDWVRAEDYRRDVERLEKLLKEANAF